MKHDLQ